MFSGNIEFLMKQFNFGNISFFVSSLDYFSDITFCSEVTSWFSGFIGVANQRSVPCVFRPPDLPENNQRGVRASRTTSIEWL